VLLLAVRYPKSAVAEHFEEIREPQYLMTMRESQELPDIRAAHARSILRDPRQSIDNKLRVMLALQHMRPKVSVPLLQGLLSDPAEDLRLLAYSMLEAWEKDLARRIGLTQQKLAKAREANIQQEMVNALQKLAELYWEQVDTGLARGDLRTFALEQAKEACEQALGLDARLGGHWLLYGQVLMELGHIAAAEKAFRLARRTGLSDLAVMPHLARIAWELGRPADVSAFLKRIRKTAHLPQGLHQVVQFWAPGRSSRSQL
jgi:tetratricopeptide (TPR) repeat protein